MYPLYLHKLSWKKKQNKTKQKNNNSRCKAVWFPGHMDWERRKRSLGNTRANVKRRRFFWAPVLT